MADSSKRTNGNSKIINRPYKCTVEITFPSKIDAQRAMDVLSVDNEVGERAVKFFTLLPPRQRQEGDDDKKNFIIDSILEM